MYTALCQDSLYASYFQMNGAGAEKACACFADQLVSHETAQALQAIDRNLSDDVRRFELLGDEPKGGEQKKDFHTVIRECEGASAEILRRQSSSVHGTLFPPRYGNLRLLPANQDAG